MKSSEIRELNLDEIVEKRDEFYEELYMLRQRSALSHLENPKRITVVKKTIARLNTIAHEKQLAADVQESNG